MDFRRPAALLVLLIMLAGCGSATNPPGPSPSPSAGPSSPAATPTIPANGISLRRLGFEHGPTERLSLPRDVTLVTAADQPNAVTLVISRPSVDRIADYLRRSLPKAGFKIESDVGSTLTFSGYGWSGSFTGSAASSALVITPR